MIAINDITQGKRSCPQMLGEDPKTRTVQDIPKAIQKALEKKCPGP